MWIYGNGRLIYQAHSDEGVIEVVDSGDSRSLHFGTFPRQSSMRIGDPTYLELSYTQSMMGCLLLNPSPRRVLLIGLGGGSLVRFLLHHFPQCQIDVVEYRRDVIEIAERYFNVPLTDSRLKIMQGEGSQYVRHLFYETDLAYDLLMVDAYHHSGMANSVGQQSFFDACAGIISADGVMSINLWGSERARFNITLQRINQSFGGRSMLLPVENKGNVIVLATSFEIDQQDLKLLRGKVEEWEMRYRINLPKALQSLIRQNRSFIGRLFA